MRHGLTLAAVAVWLVMMVALGRRLAPPTGLDPATLAPASHEAAAGGREEWFGVYQGARKIGHSRHQATPLDDGQRLEEASHLELAMLGTPQAIDTTLVAETDRQLRLRRFDFTLASPVTTFSAHGTSDGVRLAVAWEVDGRTERLDVPLERPIQYSAAMRPRIAAAWPPAGTRYVQDVLSPLTLRQEPLATVVEGVERRDGREVLRLVEEHQGLAARVWLDADGRVLREEGTLGFTLVAEPRDVALAGVDRGTPFDLAQAARIPLDGHIDEPRSLGTLTLRITGPAAARVPDDPPRQRVRDGVLRIVREALPAREALSARGGPGSAPDARFLAPEPFVESDDAAIVARAREIVGDALDPAVRARRLVGWVHARMAREPVAAVPDAREVLRTLRGDCNEHAVLLTALARAAGIPARVVAGAMYADGAFLYHAWSELWLGEWVTADATLDQLPADATHVKLLDGGPAQHVALAVVIGRLGFAVVPEGT